MAGIHCYQRAGINGRIGGTDARFVALPSVIFAVCR